MTRPRVLLSQPIHEAGMALLASRCDPVVAPDASVATLRAAIRDAQGLLARTAPIPAEVIEAAPGLKVIARHGVGVDNIDVAAATRRGIPVAYTPDANRVSVAEHVLALLLALAKRVPEYDATTLHVPLTPDTRGLLGAAAVACMRPTAVLVNTSRGGVVDEAALLAALSSGRLGGAALDVFESEPPPGDHPLLALPNVIVTPHSAALTAECAVRMATGAARAIIDVLDGRRPADVVNPDVYA